jgi:Tfp pilus assembly protein PilO
VLIAAAASGVLAVLMIVLLVLPKMSEVSKAREELQAAQDEEITLQSQLRSLQDAQAQAEQTQKEIQALEAKVPPTADLPGLFRLLQAAADRAGVDFFQFSPGTPTADPSGTFSTIPGQIVVTGNYFMLQEFLYRLESLPRAAKVTSVSIAPSGGGETGGTTLATNQLQMQLNVEFYTTDASAGPGSIPGPSGSATTTGA